MKKFTKSMSKAAVKHHLATAGLDCCPYCKTEYDCGEQFDIGELEPVESGNIEQIIRCLTCGHRWMDVFQLVEIHELYD